VTFEYKKHPDHVAKWACCIKEIKVPLSEISKKIKKEKLA